MTFVHFLVTILVVLGAAFMGAAIRAGIRVSAKVPVESRGRWTAITWLMIFFFLGYLVFILVKVMNLPLPADFVSGVIFLAGAIFVLLVIEQSRDTISRLRDSEQHLAGLNQRMLAQNQQMEQEIAARKHAEVELKTIRDDLERRVLERTEELARINDELTLESGKLQSALQEIQRQRDFLNTVLDSLNHPFYVISAADYRIMLANRASRFDLSAGPCTCHALTHGEPQPCGGENHPCPLDIIRQTRQPVTVEHVHCDQEGACRDIEIHSHPIFNDQGEVSAITEYCLDITEKNKILRELHEAKDAAERANSAKSLFLANMSHEIRTPMNGVMGFAQLLLGEDLTEKQRRYVSLINASGERLLTVINDILDFSRIEAGKLALHNKPFQLRRVVEECLATLEPRARVKGLLFAVRISGDVPDGLDGDAGRLSQVLTNLVGNAIKFTNQGEVRLAVEPVSPSSAGMLRLLFTVSDTGIGIPADKREEIFQAFAQADPSHTRSYGGSGLGLAISLKLVKMLGGEIRLERSRTEAEAGEHGSVFCFTAVFGQSAAAGLIPPADAGPAFRDGVPSEKGAAGPALEILFAEDERVNQALVTAMLARQGWRVTCAETGAAAVEAVAVRHYDCILMDIQMPGMDGFAATKNIRTQEKATGKQTPIIALTAHAMKGFREQCIEAGMDDFLSKPVREEDLLRVIRKHTEAAVESSNSLPPR